MKIEGLLAFRGWIISIFAALAILAAASLLNLKFSFSFDQFFPQGDEDLEFFHEFTEEFETDDNFLLIAIESEPDIFQADFLNTIDSLSAQLETLNDVISVQSITDIKLPDFKKFPPSYTSLLNRKDQGQLSNQKTALLEDERIVYNLVNETGTSTLINLKLKDNIEMDASIALMAELEEILNQTLSMPYYMLGRPYFQDRLSKMQKREVVVSFVISIILVSIILFLIYKKWRGILIALVSIGLGLLLFMGLLSILGRELNAMSAFYPVLMLIVGTSDIIHIMTKYLDELKTGHSKKDSIVITIKEIGLATLLTSLTTAAGFLSLMTSKVEPIRDFGLNSAIGVIVAYLTVIFFSTAWLSYFDRDQLYASRKRHSSFSRLTTRFYELSHKTGLLKIITGVFIIFSVIGISKITTNYKIESNLPRGAKITEDFFYFEREFGGFRPFEFAILVESPYAANDYEVVLEINKLEEKLRSSGYVRAIASPATLFKSIYQVFDIDNSYALPGNKETFNQLKSLSEQIEIPGQALLFNKSMTKARLSSRINDIGAADIKNFSSSIDEWVKNNIKGDIINIRRTGTGLLLDKNSEYVRDSLLYGLGMALILVSLLMGLLFRNFKMILVSLVPNTLPLIFAAAILGWTGIELEAGISIVFAIVFGIAVDDTIHFLSKYKLCKLKGLGIEESLYKTFHETGRAIIITSVILFFGFLVMLFSIHPPSVTIGLLISLTLFSALLADLILLPPLIRYFKI